MAVLPSGQFKFLLRHLKELQIRFIAPSIVRHQGAVKKVPQLFQVPLHHPHRGVGHQHQHISLFPQGGQRVQDIRERLQALIYGQKPLPLPGKHRRFQLHVTVSEGFHQELVKGAERLSVHQTVHIAGEDAPGRLARQAMGLRRLPDERGNGAGIQ